MCFEDKKNASFENTKMVVNFILAILLTVMIFVNEEDGLGEDKKS